MLSQAVILCGGLGTRLGDLTATTPKPMLSVAGRPFIEHLIQEVARYGVGRVTMLAGRFGEQIRDAYDGQSLYGARLEVLVEPTPMGTGGALRSAEGSLEPEFILMNGDSWIDIDLVALARDWREARNVEPLVQAQLLLKSVPDAGRYGAVALHGGKVIAFHEKSPSTAGRPGLINAGVYVLDRSIVDLTSPNLPSSLESDVLPQLVSEGRVVGVSAEADAFFIDIGLPETYARSRDELVRHRTRPGLFLDRDAVLNVDRGYAHQAKDLVWQPDAREAVKYANDAGFYVFVGTNRAGFAHGDYGGEAVLAFQEAVRTSLFEVGAHIDAFEWCHRHIEGAIDTHPKDGRRRKPASGMIEDLTAAWPIELARSVMVGNSPDGMLAARAAGVTSLPYRGGSLLDLVRHHFL